jgi:hypothetical protein
MRKRSALTAAALFLLLPEAASAFCPESFMQQYCSPNDMAAYRSMVNAVNVYLAAQARSQAPVDHYRVIMLGTASIGKMSRLCQAVFNGCQSQSPQETQSPQLTGCTRRQLEKMTAANAIRSPNELAETDCSKYSP